MPILYPALCYVLMTSVCGNQRYGVGERLAFFVVGGLILMGVDQEAGAPASGRTG